MADFNQILTPGDVDGGIINVVNEISAGSCHKIEWNRKLAAFQLDRVEPAIFAKPTNYGFIPQTLDEDGDELDALQQGFRSRSKAENDRFALATDSEYWACLCFQTREQKDRFLSALKILEFGDKYLDGRLVAERIGIELPEASVPYKPEPRLDRDWLSFVKE